MGPPGLRGDQGMPGCDGVKVRQVHIFLSPVLISAILKLEYIFFNAN